MDILDVSHWEEDYDKHISGTRTKYWIIEPQSKDRYMFKVPKEGTGEAWAEKVASEIGKFIGLEMMDVQFACRNNTNGILAKKFTLGTDEFYEGGDLITSIVDNFDRYKLDFYDLNNISKALHEFNLDKDFVMIPFFDALIGNQDRHCDNWGIIAKKSGYKLAPIYDNGASLGFQLSEERIKMMLEDTNMFKAFTNRSYSLIGIGNKRKPKYLDLLSEIRDQYPKELKIVMKRLTLIKRENIEEIVSIVPGSIMNDIYKEWIVKLLLFRKEWLLNWQERSE